MRVAKIEMISKIRQRRFGVGKEIVRPRVVARREFVASKETIEGRLRIIPADRRNNVECLNKGNKEIKENWVESACTGCR